MNLRQGITRELFDSTSMFRIISSVFLPVSVVVVIGAVGTLVALNAASELLRDDYNRVRANASNFQSAACRELAGLNKRYEARFEDFNKLGLSLSKPPAIVRTSISDATRRRLEDFTAQVAIDWNFEIHAAEERYRRLC